MESLEAEFRRIEDLRRGLSTEVLIYEGGKIFKKVWEPYGPQVRGGLGLGHYKMKEVTEHFVKGPNTQKRKAARNELQQIYDSSEWYSAKYAAGNALSLDLNQLKLQTEEWITDLVVNQLNAEIIVQEEKSHIEVTPINGPVVGGERADSYRYDEEERVIDQPEIKSPDIEKRKKADSDLTALINMFGFPKKRKLYRSHNPDISTRAGKALGYSKLRIWVHEHPILIGLTILGSASGLVYALVEYFNK